MYQSNLPSNTLRNVREGILGIYMFKSDLKAGVCVFVGVPGGREEEKG